MIYKALPKLESSALNGMSSIVQEAFEYKHLAMAILCLCPPDSTVYISGQWCLVLLWAQNDFGPSKSFRSSTNHFGQVSKSFWIGAIIKIIPQKSNLNLAKMIWIKKNNLHLTKTICTLPKQFGWSKIISFLADLAQKSSVLCMLLCPTCVPKRPILKLTDYRHPMKA